MSLIVVENLSKTFRIAEREPGLRGALRGLVTRRYRQVRAVDGIDFSIRAGELVGYVGPNGAGKSTTIKVLSGILVPDPASRVEVAGRVPWKERAAHVAEIGVVFGQRTQLWWDLPVRESFQLLGQLYRVPIERHRRSLDELCTLLSLTELLDTPARQLSLGQRMRCDLAAALLHEPRLLFLDEPTIGLDAGAKLAVRRFVKTINRERGVTVLLTTHDMDDIEALCDRVMVIGGGQVLCDGSFDQLRARVSRERHLIVDLAEPGLEPSDPDARLVSRDEDRVRLAFDPARVSPAALIARVAGKYPVRDLFVEHPPIDELIERLYAAERGVSALDPSPEDAA